MKSIGQYTITAVYDGEQGPQGPGGPQGPTGPTGPTGRGISAVTEYYLASSSASGVTTSTSGWTTAVQTMTSVNKYLWNYEKITYTDNTTATTTPVIIGTYGDKGDTGKGISSITEYYLATNVNSGVTTATPGWTTGIQTVTSTNKYLWNYEKITYTDATTSLTPPVVIGVYGDTGPQGPIGPEGKQGIQGPTGPSGSSQYMHIRYSANPDGSGMTTTPQSNTAYIGLASTTSSTAPTVNTSYTWSLFKGPQGNQGIQGPTGPQGQTTYTWVKYADDIYGGNLSDTPSGKRYIGMAFNKTTSTESNNAGDYTWSPLYDNVKPGGRNLVRDTAEPQTTADFKNITNQSGVFYKYYPVDVTAGDIVTVTFDVVYENLVASGTGTKSFRIQGGGNVTAWTNGTFPGTDLTSKIDWVKGSGTLHISYQATMDANHVKNTYIDFGWRADYLSAGSVTIKNARVTRSNIEMDWSMAPEDIQAQLDYKAATSDLDALATIVSGVSAELNAKAGMGEFQALQEAYNKRVEQDIKDKDKLAYDLSTLAGRVTLAEQILGDAKKVTTFIETVITQAEEGIYIANKGSKTGILISDKRISFMDNDTEVAFISNQTMKINHGIFVESATISGFKFEKIPGTTILAITWVGDTGGN